MIIRLYQEYNSMHNKTQNMLSKQLALKGLSYLLKGGLMNRRGHLPKHNHVIPENFFGVCVASNNDAKYDAYIIKELQALGVNNVRLDFTYDDFGSFNERFLKQLLTQGFNVTLRLIPPFEAAKNMVDEVHQQAWQAFVEQIANTYGTQLKQVEIGNTVNRVKWSGFNTSSFLSLWDIAYKVIKAHHITLLGPNVQDFEPVYNIGILKMLKERKQLPDVHTNNLFVERITEPEHFDHRILKYKIARKFKYNLIKKANILKKIGDDIGVSSTVSSATFWAIYRIERRLAHGEQKQADYLTRYFTLLAASGTMDQASWGTLICHREGLIDDGLVSAEYPELERIGHYKRADGQLNQYKRYPSFYAMQTVVKYLSGARYLKKIATPDDLEMHAFENQHQQIHVVWTVNSKLALLDTLYEEDTVGHASILHRDGEVLTNNQGLVNETPIYLIWDKGFSVEVKQARHSEKGVAIDRHINDLEYFSYNKNGWQGLILAKNKAEMEKLLTCIEPKGLQLPSKEKTLRHSRNAIWNIADPRSEQKKIAVKQPVKMYPHKAFLDRFKPSKGKRSWSGAMELLRREVDSPLPIAYFEKAGDTTLKQNFYLCEFQASDFTIGQIFPAFAAGESSFKGITPDVFYRQFAKFCHKMHAKGIHFRDFSGGNILVNKQDDGTLLFSLIDTARLHTYPKATPLKLRLADLTRACNKLDWVGREKFMRQYLALSGIKLTLRHKILFHLYDFKVKLKRTIGRKAIRNVVRKIKGKA